MYKLKIPNIIPSNYFWYTFRCFKYLKTKENIQIEYFESDIKEPYVMLFYLNDQPIFIDVRDDNRLSETYKDWNDAIIFKSNYSSELWDNTPKEFEQPFRDWEYKIRDRIRPFIHGRTLGISYSQSEFPKRLNKVKYDIVSMTGNGIYNANTERRLDLYEFINKIPNLNNNLIFWIRNHGDPNQPINEEILNRAKKFNNDVTYPLNDYFSFLSEGKYSLNIPGITLSQPFRCIDAVLANRVVISTKIWQDIYKTFPCIELPICSYFGNGDWIFAKEILENLNEFDYDKILQESKDWYSWYLSEEGLWKNQILKQLEIK